MAELLTRRASLLFGALLATACAPGQAAGTATPSAAEGARPPDFELPTLDGRSVRLSDHLGKDVILMDFWATYCEPCLRAMPHLDALYKKHRGRGFVVLGICIDGADALPEVRAEVQKLGVEFPILLDHETRVVSLYNPKTSAPYSVLIDKSARVRIKREGYTTSSGSALERDIEAVLAAP